MALSSEASDLPFLPTTGDFVTTILQHLSLIPISSPLFRYTTWPVFMTGVEAASPKHRAWVLERLQNMWDLCPWGMIKSAMGTLTEIWQLRDGIEKDLSNRGDTMTGSVLETEHADSNWLIQLRTLGTDFLIV
jgi:hypothetical protein